jgi:hypothetical protein
MGNFISFNIYDELTPSTPKKTKSKSLKKSKSSPTLKKSKSSPTLKKSKSSPTLKKSKSSPTLKKSKHSPNFKTETDIFGITRIVKNKASTGSPNVGLYLSGGKKRNNKTRSKHTHSKKRKSKKRVQKGGKWYDTFNHETNVGEFSGGDYAAIRNVAFGKKYVFNPPEQG